MDPEISTPEENDNDQLGGPSESIFCVGLDDAPEGVRAILPSESNHALFCEMTELKASRKRGALGTGEPEWRETARWVKFEENVEEFGNRWSKPHVASLPLHALMELRSFLTTGLVLLDIDASNLLEVWNIVAEEWVKDGSIPSGLRDAVIAILLQRHRHQSQRRLRPSGSRDQLGLIKSSKRSLSGFFRSASSSLFERADSGFGRERSLSETQHALTNGGLDGGSPPGSPVTPATPLTPVTSDTDSPPVLLPHRVDSKPNMHFFKKLPTGVEAANIMIAELTMLQKPVTALVRLAKPTFFGNLTEVPAPTRFFFVLLGPKAVALRYHEIGRTMGTLLSDELFQHAVYEAKERSEILQGVDDFLGATTVLPPGEWDPSIRIEPPAKVQSQEARLTEKIKRESSLADFVKLENGNLPMENHGAGIARTGRFCGGLIDDVKRKVPFYASDFRDALHMQSLASFIFLYFASMTPLITFGGLMSDLLKKRMGAMETILGRALSGVVWGLTAGQPMVILGSTGPILVFELIIFNLCQSFGLEYLSLRVWIGLWSMVQLLVMVVFDLSFLVSYITRFTEESFAALVSAIFVFEAFKKLFHIAAEKPMRTHPDVPLPERVCDCFTPWNESIPLTENFTKFDCLLINETATWNDTGVWGNNFSFWGNDSRAANESGSVRNVSLLIGEDCDAVDHVPDAFLLSVVLFFGTYFVARTLKDFKNSGYMTTQIRQFVSDFAVIISIFIFVLLDLALGISTPKLTVPEKLEPTYAWRQGSWIVPLFGGNPGWTAVVAFVPGVLATILIFMDQQITSVIVNRKENRFRKGSGYHLDLLIVALLTGVLSVLGLPWMVADTVLSLTHVNSLKMESESAAPGVAPTFLGVREQRVTNIAISIVIGASIFMTAILSVIPMPVLFGVFLFMGLNALNGLQLTDRLKLMFMPLKYQPDYSYLRHVRITKVHLFTVLQFLCLALLWVLKLFLQTAMLFPIMVGALVGVRKLLDYIFSQFELSYLDDIIPESSKRRKEDKIKKKDMKRDETLERDDGAPNVEDGYVKIRLPTGNYLAVPVGSAEARLTTPPLNFTEEVNKTSIWQKASSANLLAQVNETDENTVINANSRWTPSDIQQEDETDPLPLTATEKRNLLFSNLR